MRSKETSGPYGTYLALSFAVLTITSLAQTIPVHQREGATHGFLVIRNQAAATVGSGELIQVTRGNAVTSRLIFRFKDGSVDDETTQYSQDKGFHLISDRHIQRGPFFPHPIDTTVDLAALRVKAVQLDKGPDSATDEHMDLPPDLSNGILLVLIKNIQSDSKAAKVPYLAFSPKARLVKLAISNVGRESFRIAGHPFPAEHYLIKVELGGITGVVAPLVGKRPSDIDVWVSSGKVPAIVRLDGPLYMGGPILSIQPANPTW